MPILRSLPIHYWEVFQYPAPEALLPDASGMLFDHIIIHTGIVTEQNNEHITSMDYMHVPMPLVVKKCHAFCGSLLESIIFFLVDGYESCPRRYDSSWDLFWHE